MPLNYNGHALLESNIPSWKRAAEQCSRSVSLCIVDNASQDNSREWCAEHHPDIQWYGLSQNRILGAYNEAIAACEHPYVMILNNDVQLEDDCLDPLLNRLESQPESFGVMPRIRADLAHENVQERVGGQFFHGHLGHVKLGTEAGGTLYLHGAAMVVRRDVFLKLGGFDHLFFYQEDNDISYRAWRAGYTCWFEPQAQVYHQGSQTTDKVFKKRIDRRAIKEKANHLFVIKNIQDPLWLCNFAAWSLLKLVKMVATADLGRAWAWKETLRLLWPVLKSRSQQIRCNDHQILERVQACR